MHHHARLLRSQVNRRCLSCRRQQGQGQGSNQACIARITADCSRVYWPGQEVAALVSIDEEACASEGALDELVVEVKGEVHSFIYIYTSTGAPVPYPIIQPIFSHNVTLYSRNGGSAEAPTMQAEPAASKGDDTRAWQVRTTLPLTFTADDGKEHPLPPSFKHSTATPNTVGSAFVVYTIKAVAKRSGALKRDSRTWTPILVTSLAEHSLNPDSLVMSPPVAAPGALPALPVEWQSLTATQTIRKALFRDRGELEAQVRLMLSNSHEVIKGRRHRADVGLGR